MRLSDGDLFPYIEASHVDGGTMKLPVEVESRWAVLLFYRGDWCPYCRRQLSSFQEKYGAFEEEAVAVVALTADSREDAGRTRDKHGLAFPVLFGLDPPAVRDLTGAFLDADESYVQATSFILRPDSRVALGIYSTGAVGRLEAADALGFIRYARGIG